MFHFCLYLPGILLERERHYRSAKKMFARALKLRLEPVSLSDQVLQNLARVLYKLEEFEASIKCYHKMATHDFYSQVGLALASLKGKKHASNKYDQFPLNTTSCFSKGKKGRIEKKILLHHICAILRNFCYKITHGYIQTKFLWNRTTILKQCTIKNS